MHSTFARVFGTFLCVCLIGGGVYHWVQAGVDTTSWPSVKGRILDSWGAPTGNSRGTRPRRYGLRLRYEYRVDGARHEGTRVTLLSRRVLTTSSRQEVRDILRSNYKAGEPVAVYYDPEKPSRAVLVPQASESRLPGVGMILFGTVMLAAIAHVTRAR